MYQGTMNFGRYSVEPDHASVGRPWPYFAEGPIDSCPASDPNVDTVSRSRSFHSSVHASPLIRQLPVNYWLEFPSISPIPQKNTYNSSDYFRVNCNLDYNERRKKRPASLVEARVKWMERGYQLVKRRYEDAVYSVKVFLGGLQYETTAQSLERIFRELGCLKVQKSTREGHAYLIFDNNESVAKLLSQCENLFSGEHFCLVGNRKAQVIPWALQEIEWGKPVGHCAISHPNTIFVGGLHGETTAEHLKIIMEDRFGQVGHVLIDTDKFMYPSGSGQVQFVFRQSFLSAIEANFLEINTKHYSRTVQLEPFFEKGSACCRCSKSISTILCRFLDCLDYYCKRCFEAHRQEQGHLYYLHRAVGLK